VEIVDVDAVAAGPNDEAWIADQRKWARGWRRVVFPTAFLAWLIAVATSIPQYTHSALGQAGGFAVLAAFAACYVAAIHAGWAGMERLYLWLVVALTVLALAELPFAQANGLIMGIFVCAVVVIRYGERGLPVVAFFTILAVFLPVAVRSWHDGFATGLQNGTIIAIPLTGLAMFGFGRVIRGSQLLAEARTELARLAAENERTRIARDLHDLLGHSLTTISVKAELAERLVDTDPAAATEEIHEVAALSRRALGDVRAAVSNYREVTLAGELASGRELLRAAGIVSELPPAVDVVDESSQELFGWVVREGLTNVVRHSQASMCTVRVSPNTVEIVDDGVGGAADSGSGLAGLAERVATAGGVLEAGPVVPRGWRLAVTLNGAR
jgi:two-component system sensor histidine kinase DesK